MIDQGNLINSLQQIVQNWIMTVLGLVKNGKVRLRHTIDQVRPHHGETLLDGAARSVRYGGIIRDRSGQPDNVNSKEVADSTNFVMGSDAAEFVNKVNDQMRKRQRRMSNVAGTREEHSIIWGMSMAVTMNAHSWERISRTVRIPL